MKKDILRLFRSPPFMVCITGNIVVLLLLFFLNLIPAGLAVLLFPVLSCLELAVIWFSGYGARLIISERDRERTGEDTLKLEDIKNIRRRLSLLRIGDEGLAEDVRKLVLLSGMYLERCARGESRDPKVEYIISGSVGHVDDYLRISDLGLLDRQAGTSLGSAQAVLKDGHAYFERSLPELERLLASGDSRFAKDRIEDRIAAEKELE